MELKDGIRSSLIGAIPPDIDLSFGGAEDIRDEEGGSDTDAPHEQSIKHGMVQLYNKTNIIKIIIFSYF